MLMGMRFDLDRLPVDPALLQKILREMAEVMEQERAELKVAKATAKAQTLQIEKLEYAWRGCCASSSAAAPRRWTSRSCG